jgi:hypothetical protein
VKKVVIFNGSKEKGCVAGTDVKGMENLSSFGGREFGSLGRKLLNELE